MFAAAMSDASLGIVLWALTEQVGRNVRMSQQRILSWLYIESNYRNVCIEEQQNWFSIRLSLAFSKAGPTFVSGFLQHARKEDLKTAWPYVLACILPRRLSCVCNDDHDVEKGAYFSSPCTRPGGSVYHYVGSHLTVPT